MKISQTVAERENAAFNFTAFKDKGSRYHYHMTFAFRDCERLARFCRGFPCSSGESSLFRCRERLMRDPSESSSSLLSVRTRHPATTLVDGSAIDARNAWQFHPRIAAITHSSRSPSAPYTDYARWIFSQCNYIYRSATREWPATSDRPIDVWKRCTREVPPEKPMTDRWIWKSARNAHQSARATPVWFSPGDNRLLRIQSVTYLKRKETLVYRSAMKLHSWRLKFNTRTARGETF